MARSRMLPPALEIAMADTTGVQPDLRTSAVDGSEAATLATAGNRRANPASRVRAIGEVAPARCSHEASQERRARVTRSPKLAAMGVATLSGLTPARLDALKIPS